MAKIFLSVLFALSCAAILGGWIEQKMMLTLNKIANKK